MQDESPHFIKIFVTNWLSFTTSDFTEKFWKFPTAGFNEIQNDMKKSLTCMKISYIFCRDVWYTVRKMYLKIRLMQLHGALFLTISKIQNELQTKGFIVIVSNLGETSQLPIKSLQKQL